MWELTLDGEFLLYLLYLIGPLIAGLSLYWIIARAPGRHLASDIASLGALKGKTVKEIIRVAGPPTFASTRTDGGQLLQWRARGYHIELLFDEDRICQGESHESSPTPGVARNGPTAAQPRIGNTLDASPPITVEEPRKSIVKQTTMVKTPTDFRQLMTPTVQNPPRESQIMFCNSCGSSLIPSAKFCDSCGNAVTQQTSTPNKETQVTPSNIQQGIMPTLEPRLTVTERSRTASDSCENCGRELQDGDKFCDKCGALIQLNYA